MKNKARQEIDNLYKRIAPLSQQIMELTEAEKLNVQKPRLQRMVGFCMRSTHDTKDYYGKIIDLVNDGEGQPEFILEEIHITKEGNPYIHLDNVSPYLNKEWWDAEIPMFGWKKCSESEYQAFKARVLNEIGTQKSLRKFIQKRKS